MDNIKSYHFGPDHFEPDHFGPDHFGLPMVSNNHEVVVPIYIKLDTMGSNANPIYDSSDRSFTLYVLSDMELPIRYEVTDLNISMIISEGELIFKNINKSQLRKFNNLKDYASYFIGSVKASPSNSDFYTYCFKFYDISGKPIDELETIVFPYT